MNPFIPFCALFLFMAFDGVAQTSVQNEYQENSIIESTAYSGNHITLLQAVRAVDLDRILNEDGPFTIFAPSDIAFKKLSKDKMTALFLPENKKELLSLLTYHIVAGNLTASKILIAMSRGNGKASFTTVQGNKIFASMEGTDIVISDNFGNSAKITTADSNQCNGVIHEIDSVILPKIL